MKKEIAERWIKALRSGKYKQGKKALKYRDRGITRHCCLGVLCELYQQDKKRRQQKPLKVVTTTPEKEALWLELTKNGRAFKFGSEATELPLSVSRWAGMSSGDGTLPEPVRRVYNLVTLNDKGVPFDEIADVIARKFEDL